MRRFHGLLLLASLAIALAGGCVADPPQPPQPPQPGLPHFTVTSDPHGGLSNFRRVLVGIDRKAGGIGGFHVTCGDLGSPEGLRKIIDARYGADALWIPVVGNHDAESDEIMQWLRTEFRTGHDGRRPLKGAVTHAGPAGAGETVYSWDYANAHFVVLNVYWSGRAEVGSDAASRGHVSPELMEWLRADLAKNAKPFVFVFGHEPAFVPEGGRHDGTSLDADVDNRDAFWKLLASHGVAAYISGHEHYRYSRQVDGVWQLCAGKPSSSKADEGRTFLNVVLAPDEAAVEFWADPEEDGRWAAVERIRIPAG